MRKQDQIVESQIEGARQTLSRMEKAWGRNHSKLLSPMQNLCDLLFALGRYDEAEQLGWQMLSISTKTYGHDHPSVANALQVIGEVCEMQGMLLEAERFYLWALSIREKYHGDMPAEVKSILARLVNLYRDTEQQFKQRVIEQRLEKALRSQRRAHRYIKAV